MGFMGSQHGVTTGHCCCSTGWQVPARCKSSRSRICRAPSCPLLTAAQLLPQWDLWKPAASWREKLNSPSPWQTTQPRPLVVLCASHHCSMGEGWDQHGEALSSHCCGLSAAALVCAVSWVSTTGLQCLCARGAWCTTALALPLLGILVAALLIWRQPQSRQRASFMVSTQPGQGDCAQGGPGGWRAGKCHSPLGRGLHCMGGGVCSLCFRLDRPSLHPQCAVLVLGFCIGTVPPSSPPCFTGQRGHLLQPQLSPLPVAQIRAAPQ